MMMAVTTIDLSDPVVVRLCMELKQIAIQNCRITPTIIVAIVSD